MPKVTVFGCLCRALYRRAGHHMMPLDTIKSYWLLHTGKWSTLLPKDAKRWPTLVTKWYISIKVSVSDSTSVHVQGVLSPLFPYDFSVIIYFTYNGSGPVLVSDQSQLILYKTQLEISSSIKEECFIKNEDCRGFWRAWMSILMQSGTSFEIGLT